MARRQGARLLRAGTASCWRAAEPLDYTADWELQRGIMAENWAKSPDDGDPDVPR